MNAIELRDDYEVEYFQTLRIYGDYIKSQLLWELI